jgi:uncharacterized membrane-anchored protein
MKAFPRLLALALLLPSLCLAQDTNTPSGTNNLEEMRAAVRKFEDGLHYQTGTITLKDGLATIDLTDDFRFLGPDDAKAVLEQLWGNPPGLKPLGMIVPPGERLIGSNSWAIVVSYQNDGYVKDADADKINYNDMLKEMQRATAQASKQRVKEGYPSMEFVGWAEQPRYDSATHKMFWARELRFGNSEDETLNYNIRVLGRRGVLVLNAVASMREFPEIRAQTPAIVKMVEFNSGNRYTDFNGSTDKVAAYGLAALVAGGVLAKLGGFKLLIAGLIAAKKFILIAFAAVVGFFRKRFGRKGAPPDAAPVPPLDPPPPGPAPGSI